MAKKDYRKIDGEGVINKSKMLIFAETQPTNLPVVAQRVFLALLSVIKKEDTNDTFIIRGKDIAALSDTQPNVVGQQLKEMAESSDALRQYTLVIHEEDGNDLRVGLISSSKYLKGERAIRVSVDKYLMPYLKAMQDNYAVSYKARGPMRFKSEYSLPLYDMMNYYLSEGGHSFSLEETRRMFNIPDGKIPLTSTLNQRVIQPAIRDINAFTDLEVTHKYIKKSRAIVGYTFNVKRKSTDQLDLVPREDEENTKFVDMLLEPPYNFNPKVLDQLTEEFGIISVKNNFEYVRKQKNVNNFSRYLCWAVRQQVAEREMEVKQIREIEPSYKPSKPPAPFEEVALFDEYRTEADMAEEAAGVSVEDLMKSYTFRNPVIEAKYKRFLEKRMKKNQEK